MQYFCEVYFYFIHFICAHDSQTRSRLNLSNAEHLSL